ncbi:MAG: DinB family protein [Blastocatellia bacterium]|nr:DinB family protein [Blastocatellia bacterium]
MTLEDIRRLYDYTVWANHLSLDACEALTEEQRTREVGISYGSIQGTLLHMAAAEWVWLARWRGEAPTTFWEPADFPTLAAIRERWAAVEADRRAYLAGLTDAELSQERAFRRLNGEETSLPLGLQMQHVVNHATLHRGQIVGMIRQLGIAPPATDLLFYLRDHK